MIPQGKHRAEAKGGARQADTPRERPPRQSGPRGKTEARTGKGIRKNIRRPPGPGLLTVSPCFPGGAGKYEPQENPGWIQAVEAKIPRRFHPLDSKGIPRFTEFWTIPEPG